LGRRQRTVEFGQLLFRQQPTAGIHDVVLGLELRDRSIGGRSLSTKLRHSVFQPGPRQTRRLKLGLEGIGNVCVGDCVRDLGGALRTDRFERDLDDITQAAALDIQPILKPVERLAGQFVLRPAASRQEHFGDKRDGLAQRPAGRTGEFLIIGQPKILDDRQGHIF
jgi:hypothetical protein